MQKQTRLLQIHGLVQGVFFRESMREKALELGITGWVRNRRAGSVEALVQGEPENVEKIIAWARRGPPQAQVERVEIAEADGAFSSFERLPTC
jgi:acylphosphatase